VSAVGAHAASAVAAAATDAVRVAPAQVCDPFACARCLARDATRFCICARRWYFVSMTSMLRAGRRGDRRQHGEGAPALRRV